jgi:glycosyltransferase involved in cell wall biosynthesis
MRKIDLEDNLAEVNTRLLLSVVTITKNDYSGFKKTEESILPFLGDTRIEWLVVDGGSNDPTCSYLQEVDKENTKIYLTSLGLYESMNFGIEKASGKYLIFMNSGDRFIADGLTALMKTLEKFEFQWAVADAFAVNGNYSRIWKWEIPKHNDLRFRFGMRSYCHQSTIVKRSLLIEAGGFYPDSLFSDWQMSLRLSKEIEPARIPIDLAEYLVGGLSARTSLHYAVMQVAKLRSHLYRVKAFGLVLEMMFAIVIYPIRKVKSRKK